MAAQNSEQTAKRVVGKPFKKGQSGNPGGRPKETKEVKELARKYTQEAVQTLADIMRFGAPDRARAAAAEVLLDRGWGKPTQPVAGDDTMPPVLVATRLAGLSDADLEALAGGKDVKDVEAGSDGGAGN